MGNEIHIRNGRRQCTAAPGRPGIRGQCYEPLASANSCDWQCFSSRPSVSNRHDSAGAAHLGEPAPDRLEEGTVVPNHRCRSGSGCQSSRSVRGVSLSLTSSRSGGLRSMREVGGQRALAARNADFRALIVTRHLRGGASGKASMGQRQSAVTTPLESFFASQEKERAQRESAGAREAFPSADNFQTAPGAAFRGPATDLLDRCARGHGSLGRQQ
jgi:hypothetical protein